MTPVRIRDAVGSMDVTLKLQEDNDPGRDHRSMADPSDEDGIPFFWGDESVELEGLVWDEEDSRMRSRWSGRTPRRT